MSIVRWCYALLLGLVGCGNEPTQVDTTSTTGGMGGSAPLDCSSLEVPGQDGICHPVGVPAAQCPSGFNANDGGCEPILPPDPCPLGQMAVPGDSRCAPVSDCGQGTWGNIPTAMVTVFVDANYTGGNSNGSMSAPFTSVQVGVDLAPPNSVVAVAAGSYPNSLQIVTHPVTLWGVCPEKVELVGPSDPMVAAVEIANPPATGTVLRGVAITGPGFGVAASAVTDVVLEDVWIHDTGAQGLSVVDPLGPASVTLRHSLIERATGLGAFSSGCELHIERSEIRDTLSSLATMIGGGSSHLTSPISLNPSSGSIHASSVHDMEGVGIAVGSSAVTISDTAVQDIDSLVTLLEDGHGILVETSPGGQPAYAEIEGTTVMRSHEAGLLVANASAVVTTSSFIDVRPQASDQSGGVGVAFQRAGGALPVAGTLQNVFVSGNPGFGVVVANADALVDGLLVRNTQPLSDPDQFGDGLTVVRFSHPSSAIISASRFESSSRAGLSAFSSTIQLSGSTFECNGIQLDGEAVPSGAFDFADLGGNLCGCQGVSETCRVTSANLSAPSPP